METGITVGEIVRRFEAYEKVRLSGKYSMIMEAPLAWEEAGLTEKEYMETLSNYGRYKIIAEAFKEGN